MSDEVEDPDASGTSRSRLSWSAATMVIGWPFTYQEHTITSQSKNVVTETHWFWMMVNIDVILLVQACVVYSFQKIGQFSVRTMMLGTLIVALLICFGRFISDASFYGLYYYILVIYYSPVIFAMLCGVYNWNLRRRVRTVQVAEVSSP